jgi:hypothetical protein
MLKVSSKMKQVHHYLGEVTKKNKPHGYGMKIESTGVYVGNFIKGDRSGIGKFVSIDDSVYEGEFYNDKYHGQGKLTYIDGSSYTGNFIYGEYNGNGTLIDVNGDIYTGNFDDGNFVSGIIKYKNPTEILGITFEGTWQDGKKIGYGIMTAINGTKHKQKWENDVVTEFADYRG